MTEELRQWGSGDFLIATAHELANSQKSQQTSSGFYDQQIAGQFRFMLTDRYAPFSTGTVGDTGTPTATMYEIIAQGDPESQETTLAIIVGAAVRTALLEVNDPDRAALVATEGVLAAMRFPKYRLTKIDNQDSGFE
jgi:hypothetical protein